MYLFIYEIIAISNLVLLAQYNKKMQETVNY